MKSTSFEDPYAAFSKEEIEEISDRICKKVVPAIRKMIFKNLKKYHSKMQK